MLFLWLAAFHFFSATAAAAQYRFDVLNTDTGLPQNSVYSILQTRDGYLWFSTLDGLVRYDGAHYTIFNKANSKGINSNRFRTLYEDTEGTLWIGSEDGGLTRYKDGKFHTYTTADGLPDNYVAAVRRMWEGTLLVRTASGLARLRGERFEVVSTDMNSFDSLIGIQGPSGAVWQRVDTELRRVKDGRVTSYAAPAGGRALVVLNQIHEDRQGRLWMGTTHNPRGELWMLKDEQITRYGRRDGLPAAGVFQFCEDREGTMWFGARGGGLVRFKDGEFTTYTRAHGLSSNSVESVYEDREGTLWVGTRDNGITRITRKVVTTLSEKDGLKGRIFYPIIEDREGSVWVGNLGVNRFQRGNVTYYPLNTSPRHLASRQLFADVTSFYEDREGTLYIGHNWGLYRFKDETFAHDERMTTRGVAYAIFQDSRDAFWFGHQEYLTRYHNGEVKHFTKRDGLEGFVQPIYEDRQGRIWIGSYGGLAQYVDDRLVWLTEEDGLSSNRVRAIYEDSDGVLWVGTYDGGLNRLKDGHFTSYTMKDGMFSNGVFAILEDARGNFWMSSNQGIYRAKKQQLNDFAEGRVTKIDSVSYGKADGMRSTECNGARHPSAIKTRDGRMWFPTFDGIAIVDPQAVTSNSVPPPVVIEQVILDREEKDMRLPIEIKPGKNTLEIHYAGLSFIKPEHVRFKYKLEGLNEDWVDAGSRRVAYYTSLPAGEYVFRVIAANADGVWNDQGATINVTVIPPFWQRIWFAGSVAILVSLAVALAIQARIRKLERARAAQEAFSRKLIASQEAERKRIAAELHDSLGQILLIIKNRAQLGLAPQGVPGSTRDQLDEISSVSSQAIDEVREIAYNLRPYQIDRLGLTRSIESMIKKVAVASGVRFSIEVAQLKGSFSKESEITFYRIVQECVNNIVKHSDATEAKVSVRRNGQAIRVLIEDNGRGFSVAQAVSSESGKRGFGLIGISERVRILGGAYEVRSAPGRGTSISFTLVAQDNQ